MTKLHLSEIELGERWGVSPKTLQRWRSEGRGPKYLKLSKRVTYPMEEILSFEFASIKSSTSKKSSSAETHKVLTLATTQENLVEHKCLNDDFVHAQQPSRAENQMAAVSKKSIHDASPVMYRPDQITRPDLSPPSLKDESLISAENAAAITKLPLYFFTNKAVRLAQEIPYYQVGRSVRFNLEQIKKWEISKAVNAFNISPSTQPVITDLEPSRKYSLREALQRLAQTLK